MLVIALDICASFRPICAVKAAHRGGWVYACVLARAHACLDELSAAVDGQWMNNEVCQSWPMRSLCLNFPSFDRRLNLPHTHAKTKALCELTLEAGDANERLCFSCFNKQWLLKCKSELDRDQPYYTVLTAFEVRLLCPLTLLIAPEPFVYSAQACCGIYKVQWAAEHTLETSKNITGPTTRGRCSEWGKWWITEWSSEVARNVKIKQWLVTNVR